MLEVENTLKRFVRSGLKYELMPINLRYSSLTWLFTSKTFMLSKNKNILDTVLKGFAGGFCSR